MAYRFGELVLDPSGYVLRRGDEQIHLEPRVLELLVTLVENRHRVMTKDELLTSVWDGQFVGESALTRAVYEARRALGDDSKRQEWIRTVHGRGYQFVAPTTEDGVDGDEEAAPLATGSAAAGFREGSVEGTGRDPGSAAAPRTLRALRLGLVAAILAGAVIVGIAIRKGDEASSPAIDSPPEVHRIALLPFGLAANEPEIELTALSLTDLLWGRLGSQSGFIVRTPEYGRAAADAASSLTELAQEASVGAILSGHVRPVPDTARLEIEVRLYEVEPSGTVTTLPIGQYELPRLAAAADLDEFVRVREAIVDDVVEHLAPAFGRRPPSEGLAPHDSEAFRLYLIARRRFATITCGDADGLLDLLDRSLRIDPSFALAWVAKGFALYSQVWSCGRDASFADEALEAADKAVQIEPDLPVAIYLKSVLLAEQGRAEEGFELLGPARRSRPQAPVLSFAQSYMLRYAGFLEEAEHRLLETLELDPLFLREYGASPLPLLYRGKLERFLELQPVTETPHDRFYRGLAHLARGEREIARAALEPAFRLNPTDLFGRYSAALLAALDGDRATARRIVVEIVRQRDRLGNSDGEMTYKEAQLLALAGERHGARDRLDRAVQQGFFCARCIRRDPFLAPLLDDPGLRETVAAAERRHLEFGARFGLFGSGEPGS